MNTTVEDQECFEQIGVLLARLCASLVAHASETAGGPAGAALEQLFRTGRIRAVMGLGVGEIVFELADDAGEWRALASLRADAPPEIH